MATKFREITKKAEDLIEQGHDADDAVNNCQSRVSAAHAQVRAAQNALANAMETDDEGNPRGDVQSAQTQLRMAQGQLAAGQRALTAAQERVVTVKGEKNRHIETIEQHNRTGQENLKKVQSLHGNAFSADMAPLAAGIVERLNMAEEAKARLLRSMGIAASADLQTVPELGVSDSFSGRGRGFATPDLDGTLSSTGGSVSGNEGQVSGWSGIGNDKNSVANNQFTSNTAPISSEPLSGASVVLSDDQQSQVADLRRQYTVDSENYRKAIDAVLFDDNLTSAEKREALVQLRDEFAQRQEKLLIGEQHIKGDDVRVLKRDATEQWQIGMRAIDETIEAYRDNLRDRGVVDGAEMEAFVAHERALMLEELSANIAGDLTKTYNPPDFDRVAASMPKVIALSPEESAKAYADKWLSTLSVEQKNAITEYTGEFPKYYQNINAVLRKKEKQFAPGNSERSELIHSALSKARLPTDMILYRGVRTDALGDLSKKSDEKLVGQLYKDDGYMSTSMSRSAAFNTDVLLELKVPAGCPAAAIETISHAGGYEKEVLIDRGRVFKITGVRQEGARRIITADYWGGVSDE